MTKSRYPGHFLTKSRAYSTTFRELRGARADHRTEGTRVRLGIPDDTQVSHERDWSYAGRETLPASASPLVPESG